MGGSSGGAAGSSGAGTGGAAGSSGAGTGGAAGSSGAGTGGAAGSAGGSPLASQLASEWAQQFCASASACCAAVGSNTQGCQQSSLSPAVVEYFEGFAASPHVAFDPAKWSACLAKIAALAGNCDQLRSLDSPTICNMGTIATGGACTKDYECSAPSGSAANCLGGICGYESHGIAGDQCVKSCGLAAGDCSATLAPNGAVCHQFDGLYCDPATLVCAPLKAVGESCPHDLACVLEGHCEANECVPRKPIGAPCAEHVECLAGYCQAGVCAALKPNGDACNAGHECVGAYCPLSGKTCWSRFEEWWTAVCH